jgi:hypothetical protein
VKTTFPDKSNGNAKANPALCTSICCVKDKKEEKKKRTPEDFNALMTSKVIYKIQCKRIGYP